MCNYCEGIETKEMPILEDHNGEEKEIAHVAYSKFDINVKVGSGSDGYEKGLCVFVDYCPFCGSKNQEE